MDIQGARGPCPPPRPVKISHKKDGHQRRPHRFHISRPPSYPATGSATEIYVIFWIYSGEKWHLKLQETLVWNTHTNVSSNSSLLPGGQNLLLWKKTFSFAQSVSLYSRVIKCTQSCCSIHMQCINYIVECYVL